MGVCYEVFEWEVDGCKHLFPDGDEVDVRGPVSTVDLQWVELGRPGLYAFFDYDGGLLYIGKSTNTVASRLRWYFNGQGGSKQTRFADATDVAVVLFPGRGSPGIGMLEDYLIGRLNPPLNVRKRTR